MGACITGGRGRWIGGRWWVTLPIGRIPVGNTGLGVVLLIPCRGLFMCPLAVAGLALRYLLMSFLLMLGHPLRNPRLTALRRVNIFGLHNDWCANLTAFALVLTEWVKLATCGLPSWASAGTVVYFFPIKLASSFFETVLFHFCSLGTSPVLIGSVHRSVDS